MLMIPDALFLGGTTTVEGGGVISLVTVVKFPYTASVMVL